MFSKKTVPFLTFLLIASCGSQPTGRPVQPTVSAVHSGFTALSPAEKNYYYNAIVPLYESLLLKHGFNGSILLAKNGQVVFEDYRGLINFKTKEPITDSSTFHVASVSKTFTAAVILKLMEEGRISLDDEVEKYLPDFPYHHISIKNLLSHRSGLPKYDHFLDGTRTITVTVRNKKGKLVRRTRTVKDPVAITGLLSNQDLLAYMIKYKPAPESLPDRHYSYCNTNYAILALIVEKITGTPFPEYMKREVFEPLGMTHSYIFSIKDTNRYIPSYNYNKAPYPLQKLDCIYGDKNVYTTVRDLLQWDRALYLGTFISKASQDLAYEPYSFEKRGVKNYGLGWHLLIEPNAPEVVYHNGWWHGNNAVFKRMLSDTATVIILGNKRNNNIYAAGKMSSVFTGRVDTTRLEE